MLANLTRLGGIYWHLQAFGGIYKHSEAFTSIYEYYKHLKSYNTIIILHNKQ